MRSLALLLAISIVVCIGCEPKPRPIGNASDLPAVDDTPVDELGGMRTVAEEAIRRRQEQVQLLQSTDPAVRKSAAQALWKMGPRAKEAIPALIEALGDREPEVRGLAARALGQMGAEAKDAAPALSEMLGDRAIYAVTVLTPDTFLGGSYYMQAGGHTVYVRANAAEALRRIGPVAAETVPALVLLVSDAEPAVRGAAARALGQTEVESKPAIRALALLLHDDAKYRPETEYQNPRWSTIPVGSAIIPGFDRKTVRVCDSVAEVLAQIGPETTLPALKELLDDEDAQARRGAAKGLGLLGIKAQTAVPDLIAVLQDKSWQVRLSATEALGSIGPEAKAAVPDIVGLLLEEDQEDGRAAPVERMQRALDLRRAVAEALRKMLPDAIASLTEMLQDEDNRVRSTTAYVVGEIGPRAKAIIPDLTVLLEDNDDQVRIASIWALGKMEADAKDTISDMKSLLEDENEQVRQAAAEALKAIGQLED